MTTDGVAVPPLRLAVLLWAAGMLGVAAITVTVLPQLAGEVQLPAPLWVISLASLGQSAVLVALAVWTGVALAPAVALRAPVFEAATTTHALVPALRPQVIPALVAGFVGGGLLFAVGRHAPAALASADAMFEVPLLARVLYGGITEELLLRWGLMTALIWLAWRFLQRRQEAPRAPYAWLAIAISAVLFGAGHLPLAAALVGKLSGSVAAFVVGANTAFGLLFGYLYWRWGLESAMGAHALSHVLAHLARLMIGVS